jgi:hypothetical protein
MNKKIITTVIFLSVAVLIGLSFYVFKRSDNIDNRLSKKTENIQVDNIDNIESDIENAFYQKFPDWKKEIVKVQIEEKKEGSAFGKMEYRDHEYFWFAITKMNNEWEIVSHSGVNYIGTCQDFMKYNFPQEMTPDCWDNDKNILIDTTNPNLFYEKGFAINDKKEILDSFHTYKQEENKSSYDRFYKDQDLFLIIYKVSGNYFKGSVHIGGNDNYSAPYIFAVKGDDGWNVVFQGQDHPSCDIVDKYNIPEKIYEECFPK